MIWQSRTSSAFQWTLVALIKVKNASHLVVILRNGTMRWKKWVKAEDGLTKNFLIVRTCHIMKNAGRSVSGALVSIARAGLCDCAVALGFLLVWSGRLHTRVHYVRPTFSQSPSLHVSSYCSVIELMRYLSSGGNNSREPRRQSEILSLPRWTACVDCPEGVCCWE